MPLARSNEPASDAPKAKGPRCAKTEQIAEWLFLLYLDHGGLIELRAIGVSRHSTDATHTETAIYESTEEGLRKLAKDARELSPRAEGVYVTLNPIDALAQITNASDKNVLRRRWIVFDFDPVRPAGTSATDEEKQNAKIEVAHLVKRLRQLGWPEPIVVDSGNGYHVYYLIELPNDDASRDLIKRVLTRASLQLTADDVIVDQTMYNASRICKIPGTLARKGDHTDERPHRCSTVMQAPAQPKPVTLEQLEAYAGSAEPAANGKTNGKAKRGAIIAKSHGSDPVEAYVSEALQAELRELHGAQVGERNAQLFKSAAAVFQIVAAGELDEGQAVTSLRAVAQEIGLDDAEIDKTLASAKKAGTSTPRDMSKVGKRKATRVKLPTVPNPETGLAERLDDPHRLGRLFLEDGHKHTDGPTLRFWNDEWWTWREGAWRPKSDREVNAAITALCKAEFDRMASDNGKDAYSVSTRLIGNVAQALRGYTLIPVELVPEQPAWLDGSDDLPDPSHCIVTQSGIVDLPKLIEQGPTGAVMPLTPKLFSTNLLSYPFDPAPPRPDAWLGFLESVWGSDQESIRALQQWFGYLITSDTSHQKILLMIGPKRSGKGTITRTLRALVGESNVAAPTLSALGTNFGLQPLIGKTVAVVPESRLTGRSDSQAIVERLLSISGEDPQSFDRKNLTYWHGTLRTRFVLLGNELPRLSDYSGAMASRLIVLKLTQSFLGHEDKTLGGRIMDELPGILTWSIAGWHDLQSAGSFIQPASGQELIEEFETLTNPIGAFLAERCDVDPSHSVRCSELFDAWKNWCKDQGRDHPGDISGLGRSLAAVIPYLKTARPREGGARFRKWIGLQLASEF